ncbi:hypothetical protein ACFW2V_13305 [Streptomyces sp. NPDC058947]|uniref:hypothetical protein n=1 Tax=Streptomyces sp. NPDC058947 TaxID=3346675 RepID=UPI003688801E
MSEKWEAGDEPWLRRHQPTANYETESNPVQCMFCGGGTLKRSASDRPQDPGRLELYCDNGACDAREMILLVERDGNRAHERADVRALRLIDSGTLDIHTAFPPEMKSSDLFELMEDRLNVVERRMRRPKVED